MNRFEQEYKRYQLELFLTGLWALYPEKLHGRYLLRCPLAFREVVCILGLCWLRWWVEAASDKVCLRQGLACMIFAAVPAKQKRAKASACTVQSDSVGR